MMEMLRYPVELHQDEDGFTVTLPDMPYGVTCGQTSQEALLNAVDCLEEIIASLINDNKDIPHPSLAHKRPTVTLSPEFSAKVLLYSALRERHLTNTELAKLLHWKQPQIEKLFDIEHSSSLSKLSAVASALGKNLVIGLEDSHQTV